MAKLLRTGFSYFSKPYWHNGLYHKSMNPEGLVRLFGGLINGAMSSVRLHGVQTEGPFTGVNKSHEFYDKDWATTTGDFFSAYVVQLQSGTNRSINRFSTNLNTFNSEDEYKQYYGYHFQGRSDNQQSMFKFDLSKFSKGIFINYWTCWASHTYYSPTDIFRFHFGGDLYSVSLDTYHDLGIKIKNHTTQTVIASASWDIRPISPTRYNIDFYFDENGKLEFQVGDLIVEHQFTENFTDLQFFSGLPNDYHYMTVSNLAINDGSGASDNSRPKPFMSLPVFPEKLSLEEVNGYDFSGDRATYGEVYFVNESYLGIRAKHKGNNNLYVYFYDKRYTPFSYLGEHNLWHSVDDPEATGTRKKNEIYIQEDLEDGSIRIRVFMDYHYINEVPLKKLIELVQSKPNDYFEFALDHSSFLTNRMDWQNSDYVIGHFNHLGATGGNRLRGKQGGDLMNSLLDGSTIISNSANPNIKFSVGSMSDIEGTSLNPQSIDFYNESKGLNVYFNDYHTSDLTSANLQVEVTDSSDPSAPTKKSENLPFGLNKSTGMLSVDGLNVDAVKNADLKIDVQINRYPD